MLGVFERTGPPGTITSGQCRHSHDNRQRGLTVVELRHDQFKTLVKSASA
jgi:hypothetical protein